MMPGMMRGGRLSADCGWQRLSAGLLVVAACCGGAAERLGAAEGELGRSAADVSVEATRLIRQLGDPQRSRREAATERLEAFGVGLLPLLDAATPQPPGGEAAWRLRMLRERLETRAIAAALEPTLVAASPAGTPVPEAFAAVFASAGGEIALAESVGAGKVVAETSQVTGADHTYWEEVERLLEEAGGVLTSAGGDGDALLIRAYDDKNHRLEDDAASRPPTTAAGPLRVEVLRAVAVPPEQPRAMRLTLRVAWEPRLRPIMLQLPMGSLIAEGPAGEVVPPKQRQAVVEASPRGDRGWVSMSLLLDGPPATVDRVAILRGTLRMWVPASDVEARFPLASTSQEPVERRFGDAVVRLESASVGEQTLTVRLRADYSATEALASHRTWLAERRLQCHLQGAELRVVSDRVVRRDERGIAREAVFRLPEGSVSSATGAVISWRLPLAIRDVPVDFLLQGLPLPSLSDAKNPPPQ